MTSRNSPQPSQEAPDLYLPCNARTLLAALASALMKISSGMERVPKEDLREQAEMNAFFIIPIKSGFIGRIASTHPPMEKRVQKLREMEREMELA